MNSIELKNVSEKYRIKFIKEGQISWQEIWAVKDLALEVREGSTLGVIGQNGSGKTTLLKLIAGMLIPDTGSVSVSGRVSTIMELGAGFNPEFTGRENIMVNARAYGLQEKGLQETMRQVIEFADIGEFVDAPIKYYSQGMYMRLAFALAISIDPDVLLIDDILAVGDEEAQQKCVKKIYELKETGKTIVIVSHDISMINRLCDHVVLFEHGTIVQQGKPSKVVPYYLEKIGDKSGVAILEEKKLRLVFNNGRMSISYCGNPITKGMDSSASFYQDNLNLWSNSFNLSWVIKVSGGNSMVAEGSNQKGDVVQVWTLKVEGGQIKWQVEARDASIKNLNLNLFLFLDYKEWVAAHKQGVFPGFTHKTNWQEIGLIEYPELSLGVKADDIQNFPSVCVDANAPGNQIKFFNSGYGQEARVIQLSSMNRTVASVIKVFEDAQDLECHMKDVKQRSILKEESERIRSISANTITSGSMRLFADVERKALRLFYNDKELTGGNGLHSVFLFNKIWHNTSASEWQVARDGDSLYLRFSWSEPKFHQAWKVFFKDNSLCWESQSESDKGFVPDALKFGICVSSSYSAFFCGAQQQAFPGEFGYWQNMPLEDQKAQYLGLMRCEGLPSIVWDNQGNFFATIQNSDAESHFRLVQLEAEREMLKKKVITLPFRMIFNDDESFIKNYLQDERQKILDEREKERGRQLNKRMLTSGDLRLFADTDNKALRLYYKDNEITSDRGLHSAIRISQEHIWFSLKDYAWECRKDSDTSLSVKFEHPAVTQIWNFSCKSDGAMDLEIDMEAVNPISLANFELRLELKDIYSSWMTAFEKGDFCAAQYIDNIGPIRLKNSRTSKVFFESRDKKTAPGLSFRTSFPEVAQTLAIYKYKYPAWESACLNYSLIIPAKEGNIEPGRRAYIKAALAMSNEPGMEGQDTSGQLVALSKPPLRLVFDEGIGKIFYGGKEMTTGLGMYTSVRSSGIWHDSHQAAWKVLFSDSGKITALGSWPYTPVSQTWQLEVLPDGSVLWTIDMEVFDATLIEIEQTNIMLEPGFTKWQLNGSDSREFIEEYTRDYDILPFRFWYGKAAQVAVSAKGMPGLSFECALKDELIKMVVENTDHIYKGRLLQYQKSNLAIVAAKKYRYFAGVIKIGI